MDIAKTCKTQITCKPELLESYWLKTALEYGNNQLAKEMGIHPSGLSRDKNRIAKLASLMVVKLGLPEGSVAAPGCDANIVLTGVEASKLLSILEHIREPKEKAPVVGATEANQI
ncbi:hypothetical protein [Photorhabdus heterorhabditis]|uniref:hypothetical protein n=1 Tax=Photorhabdus heterorhabditis TaxID=880156 RepID=UPI001BD309C1|nr:hypothetical protein [Photorhabdus heterorhabditis]MBS9442464.1 hypothetical protein [Photorhabdus heterorhabditis]